MNIGPRLPQAFSSHSPTGISLENPDSYRFIGSSQNDDETLAYRSMYTAAEEGIPEAGAGGNSGASVSMVSGTVMLQNGQSALDFLERTSMDAQVSSDKIRAHHEQDAEPLELSAQRPGQQPAARRAVDRRRPALAHFLCLAGWL